MNRTGALIVRAAARNRALQEATMPVVAFSDDDAVPEPEWLGHLLEPFADPLVLCTSGLTLALELETPAQEWFERYSPFGRGFDHLSRPQWASVRARQRHSAIRQRRAVPERGSSRGQGRRY